MISQRAARPSGSVERLHQMCLSNLKGVDETRAPTDPYSVFRATNFTSNPDGSFSIRKPLLIKRDWTRLVKSLFEPSDAASVVVTRIVPLYTESDFLILFKTEDDNCFTIYNSKTKSFAEKCMLKWHDVSDVEHFKTMFDSRAEDATPSQFAVFGDLTDLTAGSFFHTSTTTTVGNCNVKLNSDWFEETVDEVSTAYPMCDTSLYDESHVNGILTISKPRYIQIYFDLGVWYFSIYNPAVNTFEASPDTGSYEHPLDTVLDDMYVLRDTYNTTVPAVKQIVPYVYTKFSHGKVVPDNTVTSETSAKDTHYTWVTDASRTTSTTIITETVNATQDFIVLNTNWFTLTVRVHLRVYSTTDFHIRSWVHGVSLNIRVDEDLSKLTVKTLPGFKLVSKFKNNLGGESYELNTVAEDVFDTDITLYNLKRGATHTLMDQTYSHSCLTEPSTVLFLANVIGSISAEATYTYYKNVGTLSVSKFTESLESSKFRGVSALPNHNSFTCALKAFCNFPNKLTTSKYYATWLYTLDGRTWQNMLSTNENTEVGFANSRTLSNQSEEPIKTVAYSKDDSLPTVDVVYAPFESVNGTADTKRVDVLKISEDFLENYFTNAAFRFKIVLVEDDKIVATYGQADYIPVRTTEGQYWYSELGNSALGEKVYHKGRIFSFGDPSLKNNVFVSYPGEFVTPFKNIIDVNASEDVFVTSVVPWKDYLILTTPQAIYLASQVDTGYLTKTVNTALGISQHDAHCITPTLNGLIFKSENKIYMLYPNVYAGDDSVINVTEISKPVESFLFEHEPNPSVKPFAFGTESEYVLVLPEENCSKCLVYNYTTKIWNCLQFPVVFQYYTMYSLTDIVLFGNSSNGNFCEYNFNKSFAEAYGLADGQIDYGDVLVEPADGIEEGVADIIAGYTSPVTVSPIEFELDTGQKSDQILTKKQFVETKIVVATSAPSPTIDMDVIVHVDGDRNVTKNMSTDAAFWKAYDGGAVLNTTLTGLSNESDSRDVLRQLSIRYSGRGNSVRHILRGTCSSNFKLYETYIRYKLLNVK